jgi:predicted transcriptional regulator/anti-sigma regulatory factor (Ser/Thr protein kinase)
LESDQKRNFEQSGGLPALSQLDGVGAPFSSSSLSYVSTRARIAIYDDMLSAPRIIDINPASVVDFIEDIASNTYEYARRQGGSLPYTVIREIAENFIHAQFKECAISVLDKGNTIRFSDQGPGIEKKRLVQQPGITSATAEMKQFIRGVGSGFPIVKEYLEHQKGILSIDDNAHEGTVITLSVQPDTLVIQQSSFTAEQVAEQQIFQELDERSFQVLHMLYDEGILGVSDLIKPLGISAATAHRTLVGLEQKGFIELTSHRKRILSSAGLAYLEAERQHG